MDYILHFAHGKIKKIDDVVNIRESKTRLTFIFANSSKLEIIKKFLLYYELAEDSTGDEVESEEVLNRFDNYLHRFMGRVEGRLAQSSNYPAKVEHINGYKKDCGDKQDNSKLKKVINLES